jgi:hypothetical protein
MPIQKQEEIKREIERLERAGATSAAAKLAAELNGVNGHAEKLSDQEQDLFRRGKEVLGPSAGGKIKSLLIVKGEVALARAALEQAQRNETRASTSARSSAGRNKVIRR